MSRKINQAGKDLIKQWEGLRLVVYKDLGGLPTVGWGHMDKKLEPNTHITLEQAERYLDSDLESAEKAVESAVKVALTDNQFAALVSFVFNIGVGNFISSTMLKLLNQGDYVGASNQFQRWNKVKGKEVEGLTDRRASEKSLFLRG